MLSTADEVAKLVELHKSGALSDVEFAVAQSARRVRFSISSISRLRQRPPGHRARRPQEIHAASATTRAHVLHIFRLPDLCQIRELVKWHENPGEAGWASTPAKGRDGTGVKRRIYGARCLNEEHQATDDESSNRYPGKLNPHGIRQRPRPRLVRKPISVY
jgi:hypothetical protein